MAYRYNDYVEIFHMIVNKQSFYDTPYSELCGKEKILYVLVKRFEVYLFNNILSNDQSCYYMEAVIKFVKNDCLKVNVLTDNILNFFLDFPESKRIYMLYAALLPKELSTKSLSCYLLSFSRLIEEWKKYCIYTFDRNLDPEYRPMKSGCQRYNELLIKLCEFVKKYGDKLLYDNFTPIIVAYAYLYQDYNILELFFSNPDRYIEKILLNGLISECREYNEFLKSDRLINEL